MLFWSLADSVDYACAPFMLMNAQNEDEHVLLFKFEPFIGAAKSNLMLIGSSK